MQALLWISIVVGLRRVQARLLDIGVRFEWPRENNEILEFDFIVKFWLGFRLCL
jgi:hypothetical protein